jgi:hypothetical protein
VGEVEALHYEVFCTPCYLSFLNTVFSNTLSLRSFLNVRQFTYKRHIVARSRNRCYRRKAVNITCSPCVSVSLVIYS